MTYASEVLADAPTRYWRLLDTSGTTAADSSGNSGNGTYTGTGVTLQDTGYVAGAKAVTFDGSTGAMDVSVSQAGAAAFGFECWFYMPTYANDGKVMVEWANTNSATGFFIVPNHSSGQFMVGFKGPTEYDTAIFARPSIGWHHLVVVFNTSATTGTKTIPLIDGAEVSYTKPNTSGVTDAFNGGTQPLKLGGGLSSANFAAVTLSEVALYVGAVPTGPRFAAHYAARDTAATAPITTGTAPVSVPSSSATATVAAAIGSAPVSVGSSSQASSYIVGTTTGSAPISAASSSDATTTTTITGTAPVTVASSSEASIVGGVVTTTGSAPVSVGSSSSASIVGILAVTPDLTAQQSILDLTSSEGELDYAPPFAAVDADGLPPVGTLALPPVVIVPGFPPITVERPLTRVSVTVPAMTVGSTGHVKVTDAVYDSYPTTRTDVGVPHTIIGGVDVTYFRGCPIGGTERMESPFGDVSASVDFPQITPQDKPGFGKLSWLKHDASFERIMVAPNGSIKRLWSGVLVSNDSGNDSQRPNTSWTASGTLWQASTFQHRVPTIMEPTDIGNIIARSLNRVVGRVYPVLSVVTTGIKTRQRGASSETELAYVQGLLATAWTTAGRQWTILKTPNTRNTYALGLKNIASVHHTYTVGQRGVALNLSSDMTSTVNCIMGRGISPNGYSWANWCYPNLHPDTAPAYPFTNPANVISVSTTDAGTDSGTGVSDWQQRVNDLNLTPNVVVDGVFNASDSNTLRDIQEANGVAVDGVLGPQSWAATFDVGSDSGSLDGGYRRPLAIHTTTEPYLYSANGAVIGDNPGYTGARRREIEVDFGTNITRAEATASAKLEVARDRLPGLTGTLTLRADSRESSRWFITPGQNVKLIGYQGRDVLLHIIAVERDYDSLTVTLTVDEHARDAMTVAAIRARNKDSKIDPARRPGNVNRRSRMEQDLSVEFDGESGAGVIPKHALYGGLWSVIKVPVSQLGRVASITATTTGPASKFAIALFGAPITPAHLVANVGNPLVGDNPYERTVAKGIALDDLGYIEAWGKAGEAAGYSAPGETGGTLTGKFKDTGGFEYVSAKPPWIWVAIYSPTSCFVQGRILPAPIQ